MMEPMLAYAGAVSALVTGATGSLHCALMCGPLACAGLPRTGPERWQAAAAWHLGRMAAYSLVGLALGALGRGVAQTLVLQVQPLLPWVMALGLVITAFDLAKRARPLPGVGSISKWLARVGSGAGPLPRSALLGAATPFLPCGLLYGIFLAAIATGSPWGGALLLGSFSFGALPALGAVQLGSAGLAKQSPRVALVLRRLVPLTAAALLVARAILSGAEVVPCG